MDILSDPVAVLQQYLKIDTTNSKNDQQACHFWSSVFSRYGVKNQIIQIEGYHNFETYSKSGPREKILLQNHLDVVPADPDKWDFDPFGGHLDGDYLYGRGALDMKSIGVAQAYALLKLVQQNHPRKDWIKFCSLVQEETSSEFGAQFYVRRLDQQGYKNLLVLGEGGFGIRIPEIFEGTMFLYESEQKGLLWITITVVLSAAKRNEPTRSYELPE